MFTQEVQTKDMISQRNLTSGGHLTCEGPRLRNKNKIEEGKKTGSLHKHIPDYVPSLEDGRNKLAGKAYVSQLFPLVHIYLFAL